MKTKLNNPGKIEFSAPIVDAGNGGAYLEFPFCVEELFGTTGRVPVLVYFDGEPYRGSMVRMGTDFHMILILKEIRRKIGKMPGESVNVALYLDQEERTVELAEDIHAALNENEEARRTFNKLAYSHQREYLNWINEAKRKETRQRRIEKFVAILLDG